MKWAICSFLLISLSASIIRDLPAGHYFVVWNVGQGLWTTEVDFQRCQHFDTGGEFYPLAKIKRWCGDKENQIFLSHWDLDHISGLKKRKILGSKICLALRPIGTANARKEALLEGLPECKRDSRLQIYSPTDGRAESNDRSHIILNRDILLPGDSTSQMEKFWRHQLPGISRTHFLILGHHGSKTSTSEVLVQSLPELKMAIASARWKKYHHPHFQIQSRLKEHGIPLLRTEEWGNLWFAL
jgi:competence protein ComEC